MTHKTLLNVVVLSLCMLGQPPTARADDDRAAYAERLFQHGVELMKSDNCQAAVGEFLTSQELDPSAATLINLATCYARLGRKAKAWKTYRQAAAAAATEKDEQLRSRAFQAMSMLSPTLTKLKIVAPSRSSALSLRLNGEPLENDDGLPIPLDPGENVIEAVAPGREPWRRSLVASEVGATFVIEVPELRPLQNPAHQPQAKAEQKSEQHVDLRTPAIIIAGIGATGLLAGAILGINAKQKYDESEGNCRAGHCNSTGVSLREEALNTAALSTYTMGFGAVLATTGVVLWFTAPKPSERKVLATPWIQPEKQALGVVVQGGL